MLKQVNLMTTMLIALLFISCAKERPYEQEEKDVDLLTRAELPVQNLPGIGTGAGSGSGSSKLSQQTINISDLNRQNDLLYVTNTQGVPRFTREVAPYVQGQERVIQLFYTETAIVGYEMEDNKEFSDNPLNNDPIIRIPVTYKSFRCRENANFECTNKEEENTDDNVEWFQKPHVLIDYKGVTLHEHDSIRLENRCYSESNSELVHHEVNGDMIYFEVKKTFDRDMSSWRCLSRLYGSIRDWDDFAKVFDDADSFETVVSFSVMRLNKIASPNYKAINYPVRDQNFFGFFKTVDFDKIGNQEEVRDYKMNRWNPNKNNGVIDYYMSREYNKPSNKYLKDATILAFDRMNKALEYGGVKLRLNLKSIQPGEETKIRPGDMRYSMVVLIEDIANRLLGYGPSVANPETGEIVKAHTNMYKGTLELVAPRVYDNLIELEELDSKINANSAERSRALQMDLPFKPVAASAQKEEEATKESIEDKLKRLQEEALTKVMNQGENFSIQDLLQRGTAKNINNSKSKFKRPDLKFDPADIMGKRLNAREVQKFQRYLKDDFRFQQPENLSHMLKKMTEFAKEKAGTGSDIESIRMIQALSEASAQVERKMSTIKELSQNNIYTVEMMNLDSLGKVGIEDIKQVEGIRDQFGKLKPWLTLTRIQQRKLTEILVVHYYIPTLVHEIGHNLGLRHNFQGSFDSTNFYSQADRKKLEIKGEARYSSIMDYNHSSLNGLSTFGPYDVAALRFAYNRDVQLSNGTFFPVKGNFYEDFYQKGIAGSIPRFYQFCTDENAGASLNCDRFDEGANNAEIASHFVQRYKDADKYANYKNRSRNFNEYGNIIHVIGRFFAMIDMRRMHELWQAYASYLAQFSSDPNDFRTNLAVTGCTPDILAQSPEFCRDLQHVIDANNEVGRFFLDVIKTPQLTCHIQMTGTIDGQIVPGLNSVHDFFPLTSRDIQELNVPLANNKGSTRPYTCFNQQVANLFQARINSYLNSVCAQQAGTATCQKPVNSQVRILGETGKLLNDVDAAPRNDVKQYTSDIEIRGYWFEKMLATHFLVHRHNIVTAGGDNHLSFVDHPNFKEEIYNLVEHLAYGKTLMGATQFEGFNGEVYTTPFIDAQNNLVPLYTADLNTKTKVPPYTHDVMRWMMQLPKSEVSADGFELAPYLLKQMSDSSYVRLYETEKDPDEWARTNAFHEYITGHWDHDIFNNIDQLADGIEENYVFEKNGAAIGFSKRNGLGLYMATQLSGDRAEMSEGLNKIIAKINTASAVDGKPGTKGTEAAAQELFAKTATAVYAREVNTLIELVSNQNLSQVQLEAELKKLQVEWGANKFGLVAELYSITTTPTADPQAMVFRNSDLIDLQYATASDAIKQEMDKRLLKGLFNIKEQGTRSYSLLFNIRMNLEED